jgi:phosphatidylglycerol:prolipoprotein diacylglycerol transferase
MFPTLSYLVRWLTGWSLYLPIPTFGFFMALSFWAAYAVFTLEFRRKQQKSGGRKSDGRPRQRGAAGPTEGGATGPTEIPAGIRIGRLMDWLLLWCGVIGFAGALLLAKLEDGYGLWHQPWQWLMKYHGLTFYGGLLFGAVTYLLILRRRGISLATAADIGSPGMLLAYAIGRMGCHLAGDGDWGIMNRAPKPGWLSWAPDWTWAAYYPHNVIRQGVYLEGCRLDYCTVLPDAVFPTSLYESLVCLLLFFLLWGLRRRLTAPGLLFSIYAVMIGLERFLVEYIRITPRHVYLGWMLTQAQLISLGFMVIGITGIGYILTLSAKKAYFYL